MAFEYTRYKSAEAAKRARQKVHQVVPHARVQIAPDRHLVVICYEETLTPAQREAVAAHEVRRPAAPSPRTPLLQPEPKRPVDEWSFSTVDKPAEVCREVYRQFYDEGRIDDRPAALKAAQARGVTVNTSKTYYARFRKEVGLPESVRAARRQKAAAKASTVRLSTVRPTGRAHKNGVTEPVAGTTAREVWQVADTLQRRLGRPPRLGEVRERIHGAARETITKAYQGWRRFHGVPPQGQYHKRGKE